MAEHVGAEGGRSTEMQRETATSCNAPCDAGYLMKRLSVTCSGIKRETRGTQVDEEPGKRGGKVLSPSVSCFFLFSWFLLPNT